MPTKNPRFTIIVDEDLMKRIDDFHYEHRFKNRMQAALELIRLGLDVAEERQRQAQAEAAAEEVK